VFYLFIYKSYPLLLSDLLPYPIYEYQDVEDKEPKSSTIFYISLLSDMFFTILSHMCLPST